MGDKSKYSANIIDEYIDEFSNRIHGLREEVSLVVTFSLHFTSEHSGTSMCDHLS